MNDLLDPKNTRWELASAHQLAGHADKTLYVKEDDQDWGSSGMNDIQSDSELNQ